jgi:hypothetical protein
MLIHNKNPLDLSRFSPTSKEACRLFNQELNARDVALLFILQLANRLRTAEVGTIDTIHIYNIEQSQLPSNEISNVG